MRLAYAKWLLEFVEEHGFTMERGEYAEWQEAEFRVHGVPPDDALPVTSNLAIDTSVQPWEAEILACVSHELAEVLVASESDGAPDEP